MQVLRHPRAELRRHVQSLQEMVLQRARQHLRQPHYQPPGAGQAQGGDAAQGRAVGRDHPRMLQLRRPERFRPGIHPRESGLRRRPAVQAAVRRPELSQGHELGPGAVEAVDIGQVLLDVAR